MIKMHFQVHGTVFDPINSADLCKWKKTTKEFTQDNNIFNLQG